jgi:iron complex transport system substrate-binding protein
MISPKISKIVVIVMALSLATSCNSNIQTAPLKTPSSAASVVSAKRIVALTSLSADIVGILDHTKLVGISGSRLFDQKAEFKDLPRVSEGRTPPQLEKIVALKPDLVIGASGFHDNVLKQLKSSGIQTLASEVNSWDGLQSLTKEIATTIKADPQPLLDRYSKMLANPPQIKGKALILAGDKPITSPNAKSWAGDVLAKMNVANATADLQVSSAFQGYVTLSPEKVLQVNPATIILIDTPQPGAVDAIKKNSFWAQLPAVKNNRFYTFDYYGLVNPGSIDSIEQAFQKIKNITP